jgi:hypothetical protein
MPEHSPEPWSVEEREAGNAAPRFWINHASAMAGEYVVAELNGECCLNAQADAERIVACVNALAGIEDPEEFVREAKELREAWEDYRA